jgi:valyl-tRNA synthetase
MFSILMPPPNVTGNLHVGHALTYTIQDILIRYHRQRGCNTLWQPGVDHAGIATQLVVTKELESQGVDVQTLTRAEFIKKVWEWKNKSGSMIVEQLKELGCSIPWELSRFTMDNEFCKAVTKVFVALYKEGLIFRDKRLVNWDTKLETAVSDLEVQNREEPGTLWHIRYKLVDSDEYITVATTRPETIFGDSAIAVNPTDIRYKHLVGKSVIVPHTDRKITIVADEYVDIEKGTGCLKVTPAHDFNDFAIGKRHHLECISVIDKRGHMDGACIPDYLQGVYLKKARKLVLDKLKGDGLLVREEQIVHTVPYCDRSGSVIEPLLTDQWFVDAKALAVEAIKVVENGEIKFYPSKWVNTYFEWMRNIEPWCISRQIVWGHQIPAWYGPNGEVFVEESEETAIEQAAKCGISKDQLTRDPDVLDTWFSSGLWPFAALGWPDDTAFLKTYYPTTVLVTGFDIIFFWVARMIMMSVHFMKRVPFKDVYVHALVRDGAGQKMSKSKGNVIAPHDLMEEFGADALRLTLALLSVPGRDVKLSRDNVKINRNFLTKVWNAARFLQTKNIPAKCEIPDAATKGKVNNWIIAKFQKFQGEIDQNIQEYRFDYAARNIQSFLRNAYCDFFIEAVKLLDDDWTKAVALRVYAEYLRVAHPIIPLVTDHIAQSLGICDSLILGRPNEAIMKITTSDDDEAEVDEFVELLHRVRSAKQTDGAECSEYPELRKQLQSWQGELHQIAGIV